MVETGGSIFIALLLVVMLMSLVPVCIFFVRKVSFSPVLNTLSLLSLFVFIKYLAIYFIMPGSAHVQAGLQLAEFTLVFYLFKLMTPSRRVKEFLAMLLVAFLSVIITLYSLKSITIWPQSISMVQAAMLTVLAIISLLQLIGNRHIVLINEPVFWIAGGLLCYFGMVLFMEAFMYLNPGLSQQMQTEKDMVLHLANILRFILFSIAASVAASQA